MTQNSFYPGPGHNAARDNVSLECNPDNSQHTSHAGSCSVQQDMCPVPESECWNIALIKVS